MTPIILKRIVVHTVKNFSLHHKMDNIELNRDNKRDSEPSMKRLCSEPIELYKIEFRHVAPHMRRLSSEPMNLDKYEHQNSTDRENESNITRLPSEKKIHNLSRSSN